MKVRDIVSKTIMLNDVPVHFTNTKSFTSITYLKSGTDKERGLYLPDCDSLEALNYCKINMPDGYERIQNIICSKCEFDEITFTMFSILHELGHWIQYRNFINAGHNDKEFIAKYESERALLYLKRNEEYVFCKCKEDVIALNKKYDQLYAGLPTEKYANNFALEHLPECM